MTVIAKYIVEIECPSNWHDGQVDNELEQFDKNDIENEINEALDKYGVHEDVTASITEADK